VEEAVDSGIEDIVFVTRAGTQAVGDHFGNTRDLETHLAEQGKGASLRMVEALPRMANFAVVRQGRHLPYGNGTPLLAAKSFLDKNEPFVYMFGDDLVLSETPCAKQLIDVYTEHGPAAVVAFQDMAPPESLLYGQAKLKEGRDPKELASIIEKPTLEEAPSTLAQLGRFVLPWRVIEILETQERGKGNELWLTDANDKLCREERVIAHTIEGKWYTIGDPLRFLKATVEYALRNPDIGEEFAAYLRTVEMSGG
jgi:UTP--glucose-1-phosphate uridylyltransferase